MPTGQPIPLHQVRDDEPESADAAPGRETGWVRRVNDHELVDRIDWRSGPLCRAVMLTRSPTAGGPDDEVHDLLLTMPHCVADGTTVLSLLRQWIELAGQACSPGPSELAADTSEPALPACEAMFPAATGAWPARCGCGGCWPGSCTACTGTARPGSRRAASCRSPSGVPG
ncbi:hypothetical protein GCM10029963_03500 [Micromonospora andamanensis]